MLLPYKIYPLLVREKSNLGMEDAFIAYNKTKEVNEANATYEVDKTNKHWDHYETGKTRDCTVGQPLGVSISRFVRKRIC